MGMRRPPLPAVAKGALHVLDGLLPAQERVVTRPVHAQYLAVVEADAASRLAFLTHGQHLLQDFANVGGDRPLRAEGDVRAMGLGAGVLGSDGEFDPPRSIP